ncbi:MAG: glycosyltransferase family 2 protein [Desulfobacterales bacterium]|nr:glycosyltransferase family 2 protein [Desulfobacterales bacterium]
MTPAAPDKKETLISVCIPAYNASRFIGKTIQSVLDSTWSNLEVIVSDDASGDATREVVESFEDDRVRLFRNESNLGAPGNWNRALEHATGEYVGLLNHDDLYGPFWLAFAAHHLDKDPDVGWVTSAYRAVDHENQTLEVVRRLPETRKYSRGEAFCAVAKMGALLPVYIARREVLAEAGPYDEDDGPYADHGLHLRLASRRPMVYSANPLLASYRRHADNLMHMVRQEEKGDRAIHCLRMLDKARGDDALPEEARGVVGRCYAYFHNIILNRCKELLAQGDPDTVRRLIRNTPTRVDVQESRPTFPGGLSETARRQKETRPLPGPRSPR